MLLTPLLKGLGRAYRGTTFTGTQEEFWPDALPTATNDSYVYQWEVPVRHLNHRAMWRCSNHS